jgi:hypothetical protein
MKSMAFFLLIGTALLSAQTGNERWNPLRFLEGTWDAKTQGETSGVNATGAYTFRKELGGHILARHTSATGCKGPVDFNCEHGDLLYIYQDLPDQPLKAIYFDNEGHVIHYTISTPTPTSAVFLSDPSAPGPQFRLTYELSGTLMSGKFQIHMPGQAGWKSYLEWSGVKQ